MTRLTSKLKRGGDKPEAPSENAQALLRAVRRTRRDLRETDAAVAALRTEVDRLRLEHLDARERLRGLIGRVEHYQPLYAVPGLIEAPARPSRDRAVAIADRLGDLDGLRVFDVGSSLGYMCMYLADRGATTLGWDMNVRNVEVARQVAQLNGVPATFACRTLDVDGVAAARAWQPDAVLMLSVLHHVIYYQGLDAAQEIVAALAGPTTRFVVELATGDEDPDLPWSASQPADPYAPFDTIPGGYDADVIGTFGTHLSTSARDLVLITPRQVTG